MLLPKLALRIDGVAASQTLHGQATPKYLTLISKRPSYSVGV